MLYLFRLLFLLINIDQETVLNWFGVDDPNSRTILSDNVNLSTSEFASKSALSIETCRLIVEGLWKQVQDGLTLADIENLLFFLLFIRFVILTIRYNLKTSFYITSIGLFAGCLWCRHLIDLIGLYRSMLIQIPYLRKLGIDATHLSLINRKVLAREFKLGNNVHWYNPGQVLYYALIKGIIKTDPDTGLRYYIDPISMFISNLDESQKENILPIYYKIYNQIIPQAFEAISKFWTQLSGIVAYTFITRIGKKYCPYLIRWHWTFLLIAGFLEQIFVYFSFRISYFQSNILMPELKFSPPDEIPNLLFQINFLNGLLAFIVCLHFGFVFFGLFHAIWGQYFYFPFLVENTELHIGPRPKNSIYSGGNTSWQDEKEQNIQRVFPKLWYGWFGSGTNNRTNFVLSLQKLIKNIIKRIRNNFRK